MKLGQQLSGQRHCNFAMNTFTAMGNKTVVKCSGTATFTKAISSPTTVNKAPLSAGIIVSRLVEDHRSCDEYELARPLNSICTHYLF